MYPESTKCSDLESAIAYIDKRNEELRAPALLRASTDPSRVTMNDLFDDFLANQKHEPTRKDYEFSLNKNLRPYFGKMLASELTVRHCQAYRKFRRTQLRNGKPIQDTTINRDLSKVQQSFKIGIKLGTVHAMPPGGCDFHKKPETQNTRRVRLPDSYYTFFRDAIHPALKCAFVLGYHIGRRKADILNIKWNQIDFDERCIYFEITKTGPVKCPFFGEMEKVLRHQKELREVHSPRNPFICFWYDLRTDKEGEPIKRFDTNWKHAVDALKEKMVADGVEPIDLHFHDLRRSAHYQMRKAGIDSLTRRSIMGHKTDSMDSRYGMVDDEALDDARAKMEAYQQRKGLPNEADEVTALKRRIAELEGRVALPNPVRLNGKETKQKTAKTPEKAGLILVRQKMV